MEKSKKYIQVESYWDIVWKQFKKRKTAVISLWIIYFLFFVGIFAPFLANDKPLLIYTSFGDFYQYHFASWNYLHQSYSSSLNEISKLQEENNLKLKEFEKLKQDLFKLNQNYDLLGNDYEEKKETSDDLDKQISELMKSENKDSPEIKQELATLKKEKNYWDKKKADVGNEQRILKSKIFKMKNLQDQVNTRLVQLVNKLDLNKISVLMMDSLKDLKFPVSERVQDLIDKTLDQYEDFFNRYNEAIIRQGLSGIEQINIQLKLGQIKAFVDNNLSVNVIQKDLVKKRAYPVFNSLSLLDVVFMVSFILFILMIVFNKLLIRFFPNQRLRTKIKIASFVGFNSVMVFIFFTMHTTNYAPSDYKKLLFVNYLSPSGEKVFKNDLENITNSSEDFAIFPPVPFGYSENFIEEKLQKPLLFEEVEARHYLGTGSTGQDILSRMIWGARISLSVGFVAVSIYVLIGIIVGAIAGYFGGWVDILVSRIIEIVMCFPTFFLILTIIAFLGPSILNIMIVIGITNWTGVARLTRGEFLKLRNNEFVLAARTQGVSNFRIIFVHILPNALTPVLVTSTFGIASAIILEANLSFLGFGVQPPFPSWGEMISKGQSDALTYWWLSIIPGIAIFVSVTIYNFVGDALRDAIDPRLRN